MWYAHPLKNEEEGFLGYVEAALQWKRVSSNIRLQYFETNSYNSRIYVYESDVLYSFSIPAFYDKGFRYYLNFSCNLSKRLKGWMRWAQTVFADKQVIGSGLDEIKGRAKSEIKVQMEYIF